MKMQNKDKPQWEHHCKHCTFLTSKDYYDYYIHVSEVGSEATFLVRYGDDPEDYQSASVSYIVNMMLNGFTDHEFVDCMKYAIHNDRVLGLAILTAMRQAGIKVVIDKEIKEEISQRMAFIDETVNAISDGIIIIREEQ